MKNVNVPAAITILAAILAILWSGSYSAGRAHRQAKAVSSGTAAVGGDFTLTDQNGKTVHAGDYRGKAMLIYFGYTHCATICPVTVAAMSKAMDLLGPTASNVAPLFITVDPARDTPAALKAYLANFNKHMVSLTGTDAQIASVAAEYKAYFAKQGAAWSDEKPGHDMHKMHGKNSDYLVDHSGYIYLMDKNGKFAQLFPYNASPQDIAADITTLLNK